MEEFKIEKSRDRRVNRELYRIIMLRQLDQQEFSQNSHFQHSNKTLGKFGGIAQS
jgi:hypothetical protein